MKLNDFLRAKKPSIRQKWLKQTLAAYPPDASLFYSREKNQFANPVGQTHAKGIEAILDALFEENSSAPLIAHLDDIIRIRSVQEMTPSKAVSFIFLLKEIVAEETKKERGDLEVAKQLDSFFARIDETALAAFDMYVKYREKVYQLRVNEIKRSVSRIIRETDFFDGDLVSQPDQQPGNNSCQNPQRGGGR